MPHSGALRAPSPPPSPPEKVAAGKRAGLAGAGKKVIAGIRLTTSAESAFGMVVQETTVRESEETEEVWEAEGAVATGEESIEQVWSEYRALYSFEGQEGEVSLERGERLLVSSEDAPDGLAVS